MDPQSNRRAQTHRRRLHRLALLGAPLFAGLLACAALLAAWGGPVRGAFAAPAVATLNFPGSGACTTDLQACIDSASPGDTILIQPGTYTVGVNLAKRVNLTGVSSATVFLNALDNQRVLTVTGVVIDSSTVISGLTISGGHAVGGACPAGCGGAIFIGDNAQPQLVNLTFVNNSADLYGGGVYADVGSPLTLSGVAMLSNTTTLGNAGGAFGSEDMTINGGLFQNNQCNGDQCQGGAIYTSGSLTVTGSVFLGNASLRGGGGAFTFGNLTATGARFQSNQCTKPSLCIGGGLTSLGTLVLSGTQVLSNTSTDGGGGVFANANATLTSTVFLNNQGAGGVGGGLSVRGSLLATGTKFISNTSADRGGGALVAGSVSMVGGLFQANQCTAPDCVGGGLWMGGPLTVTNTVFLNNQAQLGGGLFHGGLGGDGLLVNSLFAGNQAADSGQAIYLASPGQLILLHTTIASPTVGNGSAVFVGAGTVGLTNTLIANYSVGIENAAGAVFEDYSLFSGVGAPYSGTVSGGAHSHPGLAGFVDPAKNNYHLAPGSAAIDAGVDAGINFDIDGDPRPLGRGFDIGFDEFLPKLYLPLIRR